ncbi:unnamed protein product [Brassica rapa]|uniref:Uncharacterized protein n=1 Tax=Brassica campestris TaxID=3711 RepID=A0A3P5YRK2_BRACM|nr:unnamed protein product [Brassica rapa]VDC64013.1 unnamed protein product [Brassica rapa]
MYGLVSDTERVTRGRKCRGITCRRLRLHPQDHKQSELALMSCNVLWKRNWLQLRINGSSKRRRRCVPKAVVKPTILESRFAHPRDELIYKIDSKVILLVTCPDLKEPYEELPWDYILQAQALLALCDDADDVHIYCWTEQGSSLFRTGRDYTLWTMASVAVAEFWEGRDTTSTSTST